MDEKKKFVIICPGCGKEIVGFSQHHVEQNLFIHQQTSQEHKRVSKFMEEKIGEIKKK